MNKLLPWEYYLVLLAGIVCPAASFAGAVLPVRECRLEQVASIDLKIGSVVLMPVTVNGTSAFMGLNTATSVSAIWMQVATKMNLAIGKAPELFSSAPGMVSIDSLSLGSYEVGKVQVLVYNAPTTPHPSVPPYIGWFAITSLLGVDFELDFAHNKLNLFSTNHCAGNVVYWTDKAASVPYSLDRIGVPVFPIELDGKKISTSLQAGGSGTRLRTDLSKALYGFDEHSPGIRTDTLDSGKTINHYRAMKMTAHGLSVTNADVLLIPGIKGCIISNHSGPEHSAAYQNCYGSPPLMLGLDVLQHLRLYFATQEHMLYITAADAGMPAAAGEH